MKSHVDLEGRSSTGFCGFHALPHQCHQNNYIEITHLIISKQYGVFKRY